MTQHRYTLFKEFRFEAAHQLPHHDGKCARLHGHSFRGTIVLHSDSLWTYGPETGMVMDFSVLSRRFIEPMVENFLDHHYLNESLALESPTCEAIAQWVYKHLEPQLPGGLLACVRIEETCTSACEYRGDV